MRTSFKYETERTIGDLTKKGVNQKSQVNVVGTELSNMGFQFHDDWSRGFCTVFADSMRDVVQQIDGKSLTMLAPAKGNLMGSYDPLI